MTTLRETAYPYLVPEPTLRDLRDRFTPTDDELLWAKQRARTPLKRIGLVILMKCVQWTGQLFVDSSVAIIDGNDRGVYEQQSAIHG